MKYACILQHSEEDCGAACIASIAKHYGRTFTINRIREVQGNGQRGVTLLQLKRGAEILGFNTRAIRASAEILDKLSEVPLPAILHWKGYHYVVLYGQRGRQYVIADPFVGVCYVSREEMQRNWEGWVMLLLEPDPILFYEQPDEKEKIGNYGRFLKRAWAYRKILAEVLVINLVLGLLGITTPFLLQILTDDVLVRGDVRLLNILALTVGTQALLSAALALVQSNLVVQFAQRLELGLILEFGQHILQLPLTFHQMRRSGELTSRLRDIEEINHLVSQIVIGLPNRFFVALVGLCCMVIYSWKLTLGTVASAALMTLSAIVQQPRLRQATRRTLVLVAENQAGLIETLNGILTVKAISAAPQIWEVLQGRFGRQAHLIFRTNQISIINEVFSNLVAGIGSIALLWFGSTLVIQKELTIGQLVSFKLLNDNALLLVSTLIRFIDEFTRVKAATERLTEVLEATSEGKDDSKKPFVRIPSNADIICTEISFQYAGRGELFEQLSLTLPGGKVIALVGESGGGKSSLAKLIANLYPLQSGNICIGYNLQDLPLDCVRQQIVLVPQEVHFWSVSILENFRLCFPQVTFEEVVAACRLVEADSFINKLPYKYQTVLGEFGANISGGQRQRLAIARAIVIDPPVLILDESTTSLDPVTERLVLDRILSQRQGKTTILVSHRAGIINRADWLVLIDQGKVKTQGFLKDLQSRAEEYLEFLRS